MVGVAWVFEVPRLASDVNTALKDMGTELKGHYTVDCTIYNPSEKVKADEELRKEIQDCYLLHHSHYPESSFIQRGAINRRTAAIVDRGLDLLLTKVSSPVLVPDTAGKFEVTGNEYQLVDFYIRVGAALMNSNTKGVIVEIEYAPSALPSQCGGLLEEAVGQLFPELKLATPKFFLSHEEYIMADTVEQYLKVFQEMRQKAT
uniref:Mediator of RNA polymerase II transcription subunit 20 n=1 Tax=Steinernema glaseri TaxID=37863 RepID=A0A1I7XZS3_9BILA